MLKTLLAPVVFVATAFASSSFAAAPLNPTTNYPVIVGACGTNPQLTPGSSVFSGSIVPDPAAESCQIWYKPLSPFPSNVDGATGDHTAGVCNAQISGPHEQTSINVTAAGIRFDWDWELTSPPAVTLISWQCYYPWTPSPTGSPGVPPIAQ